MEYGTWAGIPNLFGVPSGLSQTVPDTRDGRLGRARRLIANNQGPGLRNLSAGQRFAAHAKKARAKNTWFDDLENKIDTKYRNSFASPCAYNNQYCALVRGENNVQIWDIPRACNAVRKDEHNIFTTPILLRALARKRARDAAQLRRLLP